MVRPSISWQHPWSTTLALTLVAHFAWEMAQAPMFTNFVGVGFWGHAWPCFRAALGDVVIALLSYAAAALVERRANWLFQERWGRPLATCLGVGLVITVCFEYFALETDRWDYLPSMPTIGGIALTPLLQWIVIPLLILRIVRMIDRRWPRCCPKRQWSSDD